MMLLMLLFLCTQILFCNTLAHMHKCTRTWAGECMYRRVFWVGIYVGTIACFRFYPFIFRSPRIPPSPPEHQCLYRFQGKRSVCASYKTSSCQTPPAKPMAWDCEHLTPMKPWAILSGLHHFQLHLGFITSAQDHWKWCWIYSVFIERQGAPFSRRNIRGLAAAIGVLNYFLFFGTWFSPTHQ